MGKYPHNSRHFSKLCITITLKSFDFLQKYSPCAESACFARGASTLTTFVLVDVGEEGSKYHLKRTIIGPQAKRHLYGTSMACRCWPRIECWLDSFFDFSGDPDQYY